MNQLLRDEDPFWEQMLEGVLRNTYSLAWELGGQLVDDVFIRLANLRFSGVG